MNGFALLSQNLRGFRGPLLGSLTLHLLVVLALLAGDWMSSFPGQPLFQVRLVALPATDEPTPPAPGTPAPRRRPPAAPTVPVVPIAIPEAIPTPAPAATIAAANAGVEPPPSSTEASASVAAASGSAPPLAADPLGAYLASVRAAIEARKDYPPLARRGRQQGTVVVAFHLDRAGRLLDSCIRSSSGRSLLDGAALRAVEQVGRFPPLPGGLDGESVAFEVPMTFSLQP